jgi:hypothetical protein
MKTNDIDVLLKKNFSQEFSLPPELDAATWQKMKAVPQKKKRFFLIPASIICFVLSALETMAILSYFPHTALKITFLYLYFSSICIIIFYLIIISSNINLKFYKHE